MSDVSATVHRYLDHIEDVLAGKNTEKAAKLLEWTSAIRAYLKDQNIDAETRSAVAHAVAYAVTVESATEYAATANILDSHFARIEGAKKGGQRTKRRKWADELAERLRGQKGEDAWQAIPDSYSPLCIDDDTIVYRDGDELVAADGVTEAPIGTLKKSTFLKRYL